jgi:hypothetical protein
MVINNTPDWVTTNISLGTCGEAFMGGLSRVSGHKIGPVTFSVFRLRGYFIAVIALRRAR